MRRQKMFSSSAICATKSIRRTGKVIFISGDDVDVKTVFVCEVE